MTILVKQTDDRLSMMVVFISLSLDGVVDRHVGLIDMKTTFQQSPQVLSHGMAACIATNQGWESYKNRASTHHSFVSFEQKVQNTEHPLYNSIFYSTASFRIPSNQSDYNMRYTFGNCSCE